MGPNAGSAARDSSAIEGSSGAVSTGGSGESPGNSSNPELSGTRDASLTIPIDSGTADGGTTIEVMDSGTTTASDGGPIGVVDTGSSTTNLDSGSTSIADPGNSDDPYESVRQVWVDTVNEYRSTVGLAPVTRASAALEQCSDQGAKKDGDSRAAHSSAGDCFPLSSQNTCPGYPVGGWGGATLADSLKTCLAQMWAEGEPPQGRAQCLSEYFAGNTSCFMTYGHYLNMSDPNNGTVACGFYDMGSSTFWMNQNFGR